MIKLDLTVQQVDDLLRLNHTYIDVPASLSVYRGDTVQAADRLCHVTGVTDNTHFESKRVWIRRGNGL